MNKPLKTTLVVLGAIVCSTLAINASDVLQGINGNLLGLAIESGGVCGSNAVLVQLGATTLCIDTYEASPGKFCATAAPQNEPETRQNILGSDCRPVSEPERLPWRFVSLTQAQQLCARAGKRLPTNEEWYKTVSGSTNIENCALGISKDGLQRTGTVNCQTPAGIHDMIGNVWEWVDGQVIDGVYDGQTLPESGYVTLVDANGIVIETSTLPSEEFGKDYTWTSKDGIRGMLRGGFYNSKSDAGIFTLNASVPLDFKTTGVGFRCVKDV